MSARPKGKPAPAPANLEELKTQMALELRADVLGGRGKLPRDRSGQVDKRFLEQLERPQESPAERRAGGEFLSSLFGELTARMPAAPAPDELQTRAARLEALERELERLLSTSTPHLWAQLRAPLRRLLNRARRELRAVDRADFTQA